MAKLKRVFVTNIPIRACMSGTVEIPDDTLPENRNAAITKAILENGFIPVRDNGTWVGSGDEFDADLSLIEKWAYETPLEK
jgi:hypothetical protein